jgi:CrcB protein
VTTTPPPDDRRPPDPRNTGPDTAATESDTPGAGTLSLAASIVLVAVGGVGGTASRYELERLAPARAGAFPWTTFAVNVSGALVLGAVLTLVTGRWEQHRGAAVARPLLTTGFLGAYTTWSTYMVEVSLLARDRADGVAFAYLAASLVAGIIAATVGVSAAGRLQGPILRSAR